MVKEINLKLKTLVNLVMKKSFWPISLVILTGCAGLVTEQSETTYDTTGKIILGVKTTKVSAHTMFDSKTELSKLSVSSTDKTQSSKVGTLSQESSGTNTVSMIEALAKLVGAIPK